MPGNRINEIDLLRFIAALMVVFFHFSFRGHAADDMSVLGYEPLAPAFKYGYLGVQLFFMISGFVILMTATGASLRRFTISRAVRLYPAFWACCTLTFLFTLWLGPPRYVATVAQYLANMTMLSGFMGIPSIDGAYWSLFVEIRFYVLVALVMALGQIGRVDLLVGAWLIASVVLEVFSLGKVLRFLLVTEYSAFFIAGAACYLVRSRGLSAARIAIIVVAWALAVFQSTRALPAFAGHYGVPMSPAVVAAVVSLFFVAMALVALRRTGPLAGISWPLIGALTYPLYLLHQNIGFMIFNALHSRVGDHVLFWGVTAALLAAAYAVHVLVERPIAPILRAMLNRLADSGARLAAQFTGRA